MYRLYPPAEPLRLYVEQYWSLKTTSSAALPLHEQIVVDGRADLMFNFGAAYARQSAVGETHMARSHLDAQRAYPVVIAQVGQIDLFGVRLRPGGLAAFASLPLYETLNLTVDLDCLWGAEAREWEQRLYDAPDDAARVALIDGFLLARLRPAPLLAAALHVGAQLERSGGVIRIASISRDMGYSIRSVDRLFRHAYGYSPKFYARVVRFQQVLAMMGAQPHTPLIDVAMACGYYDQAHFSHEFAAFAGSTPQAYRAEMLARQPAPPPNLVRLLNDPIADDERRDQEPR